MKKAFALLLAVAMLLICLPVNVFAATVITRVELAINLPVAGQTIPNNCAIFGNGYTIHAIDWEEIAGRGFLEAGSTFQEGYTYQATVWVKAADGYEFSYADDRTPAITGYMNGSEVLVTKAYEYKAWAMVCLIVQFNNVPAKGWVKDINLLVPAPSAGEMPSYEQLTGTGYKTANVYFGSSTNEDMQNGITWYDSFHDYLKPGQDKFAENTIYTFHCLVFPDEGYKIWENAVVYVNGKEAEAKLDYDTFLAVNYTFPATSVATHRHIYTDWQYNSGQHYKNCTADGCDDVFFIESHTGGIATCQSDGVCTVCGYAYIKAGEDHHTPDTETWTACGDLYHAHLCKDCGAHCDTQEHIAGPAGTPDTAVVCRDCGYIITPAKNHQHNLTKVAKKDATCIKPGNVEYYSCDGCSDFFADSEAKTKLTDTAIAPLGHKISDDWKYDENNHWRICTVCNQVLAETQMTHEMNSETCATCNYNGTISETKPDTESGTEPADTSPDPTESQLPDKDSNGLPWWALLLMGLVAVVVGVGIGVLILNKKEQEK